MSTVRQYELIYIAPPEASEELLAELHQLVAGVVEQFEGSIESTENWGRRKLAYEISGQREGVYVLEVINGPAGLNLELDRRLRVADQVMRHMVVRVDDEKHVTERIQTRRKKAVAARRVRRGLPPEPVAPPPAPVAEVSAEGEPAATPETAAAPPETAAAPPETAAAPPETPAASPETPAAADVPSEGSQS